MYDLRLVDEETFHHVHGVNEISRLDFRTSKKYYFCSKLDLQRRESMGYMPGTVRRVRFNTKVFTLLANENQNLETLEEDFQKNLKESSPDTVRYRYSSQLKDPFQPESSVYRKTCFLDDHFFNHDSLVIEEFKVLKSRSGNTNTGFRFTFSIKNPTTFRMKNLPNKLELEIDRVFSLQTDGKSVKVFGKQYSTEDILTEQRQKNNDHVFHRDNKEIDKIHIQKYVSSKSKQKNASKEKKLSKFYKFRENIDFMNTNK